MVNHPRRGRIKIATAPVATPVHQHDHEREYSALLGAVRSAFDASVAGHARLFLTDAQGLNDLYLDNLPSDRQVHNCSACRHFIRQFGGLVAISDNGSTRSVLWSVDAAPEFYRASFGLMRLRVQRASIVSPFLTKRAVWGTPVTGEWRHISVEPPAALLYRERLLTGDQAMAAARENFGTVARALSEYTAPMLDQALRLLFDGNALARSEKFVAPVRWLRALHDRPKGRDGENVLWRAIALAPEGYCHPKASVLGPLLDDIAAGLPFADIKAKFDAKLQPLLYQRPQAAPTAGNIQQAEEIVAKLGIAPSLDRRFARLEECQTIWTPKASDPAKPSGAGVFAHLTPKDTASIKPVEMPVQTMTWAKFAATALPNAEQLEIMLPTGRANFEALLTAANPDAPPILKWDRDDARNPVSSYVHSGGSLAAQWGLAGGSWATVTGIVPRPNLWGDRAMPHLGDGLLLTIAGAVDSRTDGGNALFPEDLRDDLHQVRSTIEAYSRHAEIGGRKHASACGYAIFKNNSACTLRAYVSGAWNVYRIDRWD